MNYCRNCKYWGPIHNYIGLGGCMNTEATMRVQTPNGYLCTAQNFGCVLFEAGESKTKLVSADEQDQIIDEFLKDRTR